LAQIEALSHQDPNGPNGPPLKTEGDSEVISDVGLCRIIGRYLKLTTQKGEIILDGMGPVEERQGLNESETKQWLEVFGFEQ